MSIEQSHNPLLSVVLQEYDDSLVVARQELEQIEQLQLDVDVERITDLMEGFSLCN